MQEVIQVLKSGGLVLHPTDTCYGLAVDVFNKDALEKLYREKRMALEKPVSILVSSLDMAKEYGVFSKKALELAYKYWPGALSILVPRTDKLPEFFNAGHDFVSIRLPDHQSSTEMVAALGSPVTTTSANLAGKPQVYAVEDLKGLDVDFVVDEGRIEKKAPSTIVKVGEELEIIRQGDLKIG